MSRILFSLVSAGLCLAAGAAAAPAADRAVHAPERRVYKVDSVIATRKGRALVIEAKGAVQSGGWRGARLHRLPGGDKGTVTVEFVATPPAPDTTVIEGLVPIAARLQIPAMRHMTGVRAVAEANEVTSQILH
jgi:hypothetical protein